MQENNTNATELNVINSGSLTSLKAEETLLYRIEKVKNDQYMAHFAEVKDKSGRSNRSALSILNSHDPRFQRKAQRCWSLIHPEDALLHFGIDIRDEDGWIVDSSENGKDKWVKELNILNPTSMQTNERFRIEIFEYDTPTDADVEFGEEKRRKKVPNKQGGFDYLKSNGQNIYSMKTLDKGAPEDSYLEVDKAPVANKVTEAVTEEEVSVTQ